MAAYQANLAPSRPFSMGGVPIPSGPVAPAGTFLPGTKVQVGTHRVIVDKYLSEGGFAHVYVVTLPKPVDGKDKGVLKRVAVPDKEHLAEMRTEVETMKRLRGHKQIVKYIDSHASSLKNGGYEVFLLMEWCNGGGLIDFMNTRLQNRLTEPEIIKIFTDVAEGVACMHYLKPALMHRDLKVENVLISTDGKTRTFKVCDFGSSAVARPAATSAAEARVIEDDIQRHTTLQYRSPEMIDVYRKQPIDEKADIWALGCFLYKLCYYTTPFEEVGQMAILNARFKYPGYPKFSDELKLLIASMLQEQPSRRPNIYQVLAKASQMDGRPLSIKDIYSNRAHSEDSRSQSVPSTAMSTEPKAGATLAVPKQDAPQAIPQVEPMRRGRPTKPMSHHASARPSPSPLRMVDHSDAFANLDGGASADELSSKYPKLEEFALLNDRASKFAFEPSAEKTSAPANNDLAQRVTEALADEAFVRPASPPKPKFKPDALQGKKSAVVAPSRAAENSTTVLPSRSAMISTGVGSSLPLNSWDRKPEKPIWRVPDPADSVNRSASITQASSRTKPLVAKDKGGLRLANLLQDDAARSQAGRDDGLKSPTSSRPSLEGSRPLFRELDAAPQRSKSLSNRNRPVSVNMGSRATHINDRQLRKEPESLKADLESDLPPLEHAVSDSQNIVSDVEYLRAREEEEKEKHRHLKRLSASGSSGRHQKRSSLPAAAMVVPTAAISGTKSLLHGRFGEAFRKFEGHNESDHYEEPYRSQNTDEQRVLSPIAGSVATDLSDDRRALDETEELSPELRRELEKQKLEAEERRVERAAAEYKQRMAGKSQGPPPISSKAASIQNRVQSLLNQSDRSPPSKTAAGYGRYTAEATQQDSRAPAYNQGQKPMSAPASAIDLQAQSRMARPTAPPKPRILRTGTNEGSTTYREPELTPTDDWEEDFSKRYPSLSLLDETDVQSGRPKQLRMKEV